MHEANDRRPGRRSVDAATDDLYEFDEFQFRAESNSYEVRYDEKTVPASIAVIGAMSRVLGRPPEGLSMLGRTVDLDALDALFGPDPNRTLDDVSVTFRYYDHEVTVRDSGVLTVRESGAEGVDAGSESWVSWASN